METEMSRSAWPKLSRHWKRRASQIPIRFAKSRGHRISESLRTNNDRISQLIGSWIHDSQRRILPTFPPSPWREFLQDLDAVVKRDSDKNFLDVLQLAEKIQFDLD